MFWRKKCTGNVKIDDKSKLKIKDNKHILNTKAHLSLSLGQHNKQKTGMFKDKDRFTGYKAGEYMYIGKR